MERLRRAASFSEIVSAEASMTSEVYSFAEHILDTFSEIYGILNRK